MRIVVERLLVSEWGRPPAAKASDDSRRIPVVSSPDQV
jgi:hypothetical protein